jgi:hypothetical protein
LQTLSDTADWADLDTCYRRGGKIIFYNSASDSWDAANFECRGD